MVAELTSIPVTTSVPVRSSRNLTTNFTDRDNAFSSTSSFSTANDVYDDDDDDDENDDDHRRIGKNRDRPRWIRASTREPIYSVLDAKNDRRCVDRSKISSSRNVGREKTREYEIRAVRNSNVTLNRAELPIYRRVNEKIGIDDSQKIVDDHVDEHELYSVVKKIPKNIVTGKIVESPILPILTEEEIDDPRSDALKKRRELHKWLEIASEQPTLVWERDLEIGKNVETKMNVNETSNETKKRNPRDLEDRKIEERWDSPGASHPRGVVGMVGPFCRVYRNPNELREHMIEEETQERGMEIGPSAICPTERRKMADDRENDDDTVSYVDTASESTYVGDKDDKITTMYNDAIDDESVVMAERQYRRRAKWRIADDTTDRNGSAKKYDGMTNDANEDEKKITKTTEEWTNDVDDEDDKRRLGDVGSRASDDLEIPPKYTSRKSEASNENHDKDSLNETGSTTGGTVEGNHSGSPARAERSAGPSDQPAGSDRRPIATTAPPRSLVSRILARARSPDDLLDHSEPYSELWIVLSNVYGELVVVLMMALCLAEVMDTPVPLLSLQSIYLMYLYVGSIAVIISIYLWVLVDSCGSLTNGNSGATDAELGAASLTRFGSLKRAHISRARTAPTSFYIRVGALLFGLATLVFNGLEMAMHTMMQGAECLSDVVFVHPVLHGLFTFLQMHFLFVNSQVLVERFGLAARFGFTHLAATNIAVWARLVIWDSAQEWTYFVHLAQRGPETSSSPLTLRGFPGSLTRRTRDILGRASSDDVVVHPYQPISDEQISQVVTLQECFNTNTLGQLWTSSMPFLYPFIVQFSLIAAAVTYVMGQNVGKNRYTHNKKYHTKDLTLHTRVSCDGTSKGLFLGILCMTAGIVVILIFLVVREDENFPPATLSWLTCGTLIGILTLSGLMTASGLVQVRQMSVVSRAPAVLDGILSNVALFGVQLYSVFTAVVCSCSLATFDPSNGDDDSQGRHAMLLATSILQLVQCFAQSTLMAEASKRSCITRFQMNAKPGRQVITFLLFSNAVLWAFDTVVTQNWVSQELQLRFFGVLAWGVVSRICLPLVVFYRFHSCVLLLEAWNKCYRTPRGEHPLN